MSSHSKNSIPLYVDTDNAHGSPSGDVDDAFALSALLASSLEISAIGSVFGNTSGKRAFENVNSLLREQQSSIPTLAGADGPGEESAASEYLSESRAPLRIMALGPLTNISMALRRRPELAGEIREIILVGTNSVSRGRFPPLWPFEYNLVKDRQATREVFSSGIPLRIIPLNQAGRLRIRYSQLEALGGNLGNYLRENGRRWFRRARILKLQATVPIWDLVAAMAYIRPELFRFRNDGISVNAYGVSRYDKDGIPISVLEGFSPTEIWGEYVGLVNSAQTNTAD